MHTLYSVARTRERCGPAAARIVQVTAAVRACSSASSSISLDFGIMGKTFHHNQAAVMYAMIKHQIV